MHLAAGVKHPDNMNRKEKLQRIASFKDERDAVAWWLRHAGRVSRSAFNKARGN